MAPVPRGRRSSSSSSTGSRPAAAASPRLATPPGGSAGTSPAAPPCPPARTPASTGRPAPPAPPVPPPPAAAGRSPSPPSPATTRSRCCLAPTVASWRGPATRPTCPRRAHRLRPPPPPRPRLPAPADSIRTPREPARNAGRRSPPPGRPSQQALLPADVLIEQDVPGEGRRLFADPARPLRHRNRLLELKVRVRRVVLREHVAGRLDPPLRRKHVHRDLVVLQLHRQPLREPLQAGLDHPVERPAPARLRGWPRPREHARPRRHVDDVPAPRLPQVWHRLP